MAVVNDMLCSLLCPWLGCLVVRGRPGPVCVWWQSGPDSAVKTVDAALWGCSRGPARPCAALSWPCVETVTGHSSDSDYCIVAAGCRKGGLASPCRCWAGAQSRSRPQAGLDLAVGCRLLIADSGWLIPGWKQKPPKGQKAKSRNRRLVAGRECTRVDGRVNFARRTADVVTPPSRGDKIRRRWSAARRYFLRLAGD